MTEQHSRRGSARDEAYARGSDDVVETTISGSPDDLSQVQADDALLDALGGSDPRAADGLGDQELNALLLAWRRDVDSVPFGELVDIDTAVTTVRRAALARRNAAAGRRRRFLVPVAAAAAVLAIGFTGTGLAARDAQPGDTLWALTKVLYADHARSVEAAAAVRTDLDAANLALAQGRYEEARRALEDAQHALAGVSSPDEAERLRAEHLALSMRLHDPAAPVQPTRPTATPGTSGSAKPSTSPSSPSATTQPQPTLPPETSSHQPTPSTSSSPSPSPVDGSESGSSPRYDPGQEPNEVPTT